MSYANAIIGLGVGIAAVILIIAIACYVIFSYAHMKALKAVATNPPVDMADKMICTHLNLLQSLCRNPAFLRCAVYV